MRIPRGRATVKIVACLSDDAKARRPARTLLQLLNAREKVFRPQGIFFSVKDPVASLSPFARQRGRRDFVFSIPQGYASGKIRRLVASDRDLGNRSGSFVLESAKSTIFTHCRNTRSYRRSRPPRTLAAKNRAHRFARPQSYRNRLCRRRR